MQVRVIYRNGTTDSCPCVAYADGTGETGTGLTWEEAKNSLIAVLAKVHKPNVPEPEVISIGTDFEEAIK